LALVEKEGYSLGNIDATVCAEHPKLNPYIDSMKEVLSAILRVSPRRIGIKATTNETMGFVGRSEGIAAYAIALLQSDDDE
ncbi:MAG: 2-C-methyl-D-erythritol 2,4-cyclodiphosphate synthase, partial [Bacteroidetes bacterium]|nr:2-C-methyl-D-erythritol 2,4-cyclodiphosphate synthase [Bacteroidota bacterium]